MMRMEGLPIEITSQRAEVERQRARDEGIDDEEELKTTKPAFAKIWRSNVTPVSSSRIKYSIK